MKYHDAHYDVIVIVIATSVKKTKHMLFHYRHPNIGDLILSFKKHDGFVERSAAFYFLGHNALNYFLWHNVPLFYETFSIVKTHVS